MDESIETFSIFMAAVFKKVNPKINELSTQEIISELLYDMEEQDYILHDADSIGELILETINKDNVLN